MRLQHFEISTSQNLIHLTNVILCAYGIIYSEIFFREKTSTQMFIRTITNHCSFFFFLNRKAISEDWVKL